MATFAQPDCCMSEGPADCCINKDPLFLSVDPEAGFAKRPVIPCRPRESGEKAGIHFNHESPWIPAFAGMTPPFNGTT